jgi:hypothetical protein
MVGYDQFDPEQLAKDDTLISFLAFGGIGWATFATFVWQLPWFWTESLQAASQPGSEWWMLLAILLTSIAAAPLASAGAVFSWRGRKVMKVWKEELFGFMFIGLPTAAIWAAMWLYCLPYTWDLLPWGGGEGWWKIFPYLGLGIVASPSFWVFYETARRLANPSLISSETLNKYLNEYLEKGSSGDEVRKLQELLNKHGASLGIDSRFGAQTEATVKKFQEANSKLFADGVAGIETIAALHEGGSIVDQTNAAEAFSKTLAGITELASPSDDDSNLFTSVLEGLEIAEDLLGPK